MNEQAALARKLPRTLGLSVFNPDDASSSDEDKRLPRKPLPHTPLPNALTSGNQQSSQSLYQQYNPALQQRLPRDIHSPSSSTSSIAIPLASQSAYSLPLNLNQQQGPHPRSHSPTNRFNINPSYLSSSTSDSTPPITPANGAPPVNIANGDYDGLGLNGTDTHDTDPQGLAKRPQRMESVNSEQRVGAPQQPPLLPPTDQQLYDRGAPVDRTIITATADAENHVIVDITNAKDAAFIRKRIFSKLHIPEEDQLSYAIYRTELGEFALGEPVTDDSLMIYCSMWGDPKGTLKFLVQRINNGNNQGGSSPYNPSKEPARSTPYINSAHQYPSRPSPSESSLASTSADRDPPPWDRGSNGYDGDVDRQTFNNIAAAKQQVAPSPIDTGVRRRRDNSSSRSETYMSPTSPPRGNPPPGSFGMSMVVEQSHGDRSTPTAPYVPQSASSTHRRVDSEAAALERERALEASERFRQNRDYENQMKKNRQERERAARRQQPSEPQRSDSSESAPHGWVIVEEVKDNRARPSRSTATSNIRSTESTWGASPPSDSSTRFSPSVSTNSRAYPHSVVQSHSQIFSTPQSSTNSSFTRLPQTTTPTTLSRGHLPQSPASKYPSTHPHARNPTIHPMGPPPGAIDPMMQQIDARNPQPIVSSFYPAAVRPTPSTSNFNPPSTVNGPTRMLSPRPTEAPRLHTVRSHPDLKPFNNPAAMRSQNNTPTLPVGGKRPGLSPHQNYSEGMYTGDSSRRYITPPSPGRIPQITTNRSILSPSAYTSFSPSQPRSGSTSMDYSTSAPAPQSRGSTPGASAASALFSSGAFAVPAQPVNKTLRGKQSYDRLNSLSQQSQSQAAGSLPSSSSIPQLPSGSNRYGMHGMQQAPDTRTQRPQSDGDLGDFRSRPSPVGTSSPGEALNRLEARRPSEPAPLLEVNSEPFSESLTPVEVQSPVYVLGQSTFIQDPRPQSDSDATLINLQSIASPTLSSGSDVPDDNSDGTLKPGDMRTRLISLMSDKSDNDADVEGTRTMRPRTNGTPAPAVSLKRRSTRLRSRSVKIKDFGNLSLTQPTQEQPTQEDQAEEEEEEYYEEYDSEEEDDSIFWQSSPAPPAIKTPVVEERKSTDSLEIPKARNRGPSLTLQISPASNGSSDILATDSASTGNSSSKNTLTPASALPAHLGFKSPSSPGGITPVSRPRSFVGNDTWAIRPPAEDVYDHLQDFFPNHDLDKTFIDAGPSGSSSPTAAEPPAPIAASPQTNNNLGANRFRHRRSIRYVADERKKALERINLKEPANKATNVARKRSTKLWNLKVEEVTPGQLNRTSGVPASIPESPTGVPTRATIKWVKGSLIGQGTYGKVFLALNATTGEMLAVKQVEMPRTLSDQDNARHTSIVNAIKSERETLENLDHPNIVQYLGFEETAEFFSVFLEYVPGGSVGTCLRKHGKFSPEIIKSFSAQMLDGLAYLHDNRIIHRDVKADNILVDPTGVCKISDFGISKKSDSIYRDAAMTSMQGSLFWMAPEMVLGDPKGYNAKVDIWSLGCVFLEMWAGKRPWEQIEFMAVMLRLGKRMAPPVPEDVVLDEEADDFRLKCFAQNPDERPTALELRKHSWLQLPQGWFFNGSFN